MEISGQPFFDLVDEARDGKLKLPQFQRDFKWQSPKVLRLFDSLRKGYPIGGFLFLESSDELNLNPREFHGTQENKSVKFKEYVLDGQQRITAGLALRHGIGLGKKGQTYYFLNIKKLWDDTQSKGVDYHNASSISEFCEYLDYDDEYVFAKTYSHSPELLLETNGFLHTRALANEGAGQQARDKYVDMYPTCERDLRRAFWDNLVVAHFSIVKGVQVSVTKLKSDMPVEAITTVFETINTSGQTLTAVEIVTAMLFGATPSINLRADIEQYKAARHYYTYEGTDPTKGMDPTGELFLQTIALLSGGDSKKNELPNTIGKQAQTYREYKDKSIDALDLAGGFLSGSRFYMGQDDGSKPYPAMLPPLGIALTEINHLYAPEDREYGSWYDQIERWFVASILKQRYRDAQPAAQKSDVATLKAWISGGNEPAWMSDAIPSIDKDRSPTTATGKLITCIMNKREPLDPLDGKTPVGGRDTNPNNVHAHHIFPKGFCNTDIPDWPKDSKADNVVMNIMPISKYTNQQWSNKDPQNHVKQVLDACGGSEEELIRRYEPFFIDEECLKILRKPSKSLADFNEFIDLRTKNMEKYFGENYNFQIATDQVAEEEDQDED